MSTRRGSWDYLKGKLPTKEDEMRALINVWVVMPSHARGGQW
jgi:hypothetical protein